MTWSGEEDNNVSTILRGSSGQGGSTRVDRGRTDGGNIESNFLDLIGERDLVMRAMWPQIIVLILRCLYAYFRVHPLRKIQ